MFHALGQSSTVQCCVMTTLKPEEFITEFNKQGEELDTEDKWMMTVHPIQTMNTMNLALLQGTTVHDIQMWPNWEEPSTRNSTNFSRPQTKLTCMSKARIFSSTQRKDKQTGINLWSTSVHTSVPCHRRSWEISYPPPTEKSRICGKKNA